LLLTIPFKNPRHRFRVLNPGLSVEFADFVEKVHWPEMNFRERMPWRLWKLPHFGRKPPPAGESAHRSR
jgi:hypothetical protein